MNDHRRNLLEKVLSVFEVGKNRPFCVDVSESDYPDKFKDLIRRLKKAVNGKKKSFFFYGNEQMT